MINKLLELKSVTAGYANHIVLKDIHLVVYENDFLGIIGPNGGGKSTLLKVILGLITPIQGSVEFYPGKNRAEKPRIGYLPQINTFDKKFPISVLDVILSGLVGKVGILKKFSPADKRKAEQWMEELGIFHLRNQVIGELSGGQMQRVFLCRALISSPQLLLLDEPNTYVDTYFENNFYKILQNLNQNMAIVIVSHDIGMVASYVRNIACIYETLYYHSSNQITEELIARYGAQCPIDVISHGNIPHRVLHKHEDNGEQS